MTSPNERKLSIRSSKIMLPILCLLVFASAPWAWAQDKVAPRKLPSAEKVVNGYLNAIGGKKRVRTIKDATYKWTVWANNRQAGTATTHVLVPSSARADLALRSEERRVGKECRSRWS